MIHEDQVRQLCAIHTVNNLLQLPAELDYAPTSQTTPIPIIHEWKCHGRIIHQCKQLNNCTNLKRDWKAANQEEFDNIAKELTLREQMLMSGDESTFLSATSSKEETANSVSSGISQTKFGRLSMLQRVRSQHGTPFFGNYSVDVIREALKRRGVELEFYRVPKNENEGYATIRKNKTNEDGDASKDDTHDDTACLLGLVIYEKEEQQTSAMLSFLTRIGSHIPIVKNFCGVGQHWYAITGVRYTSKNASDEKPDKSSEQEDTDSSWHVIDSKMRDITTFDTDGELFDYAREIQARGGIIFRAFYIGTDLR